MKLPLLKWTKLKTRHYRLHTKKSTSTFSSLSAFYFIRNFGKIFSSLLPGANSKLEPVYPSDDDNAMFTGLDLRVAFGGVWKASLTELSGGQKCVPFLNIVIFRRSLLALSLILSLQIFHPAPMYLLGLSSFALLFILTDEIDAPLDASHTQNIGRTIKSHFGNSQFVVISLKEGMFQNANVLFSTSCIEGISSVSRRVLAPSRASTDEHDEVKEPQAKRPRKK